MEASYTNEELLAIQDQAVLTFPPIHPDAKVLTAVEYARELEIRKARAILKSYGSRLPDAIKQALVKAECALADIAEGDPEDDLDSAELLLWAEGRAANALEQIRPIMLECGVPTSEWPPHG